MEKNTKDKNKKDTQNKVIPMNSKRNSPKKHKINSGALTLILLLVIAIVFLLGPTIIKTVTGTMTSTNILKSGVIEESFNTKAIIIRSEDVLTSEVIGTCIPTYEEGEQIPNKTTVATIIDSSSHEIVDKIKSLDARISQAKDALLNKKDFVNENIKNVDNEIADNIQWFSAMYSEGSLLEYDTACQSIEILFDKKKDLKSTDVTTNDYINKLVNERDNLLNAVKSKSKNITNNEPGVVSYSVDGYEKIFTPGSITDMSILGLNKHIDDLEANKNNAPEGSYAKIINSIHYYLVCSIKYDSISGLSSEDTVDIRINDRNMIVSMKIDSVKIEGKDALVVLKSNKALSEITDLRLVDVDVIIGQVNGIKIPRRALTDINYIENKGRIAVIKSGYVYHVGAKILAMNDDYVIIENSNPDGEITFGLNDFIVIDPKKVSEGQVVG